MPDITIHPSWKSALADVFAQESFSRVAQFVKDEIQAGKTIYPHPKNIFAAFDLTPLEEVRVVILGQDPYHGVGQAHGLSFSVRPGVRIPPSLQNIYKELHTDLGLPIPNHGDLTAWAQQGVLLLNATLTVRAGEPTSHAGRGWEDFTDEVIRMISSRQQDVVFLLWGSYAQQKKHLIDTSRHLILTAAHPSPFSAYRGFFGCRHFSQTNTFLTSKGRGSIDWSL